VLTGKCEFTTRVTQLLRDLFGSLSDQMPFDLNMTALSTTLTHTAQARRLSRSWRYLGARVNSAESGVYAQGEITQLLADARSGNAPAWDRAVQLIYADLRKLAHRVLGPRGREQTLNTAALVHECYVRLAGAGATPNDRVHFLALAARVMRQVICDYARQRLTEKRGGGQAALADEALALQEERDITQFVELDDALNRLAVSHERLARVVECRFFAGLSDAETADALQSSVRTVRRDWQEAREWLTRKLAD
jgi:RNA polymerase sigma factor (TIGR02999 family)